MAMTLRPDERLTEALRQQAEAEGRSMQAVALDAIDEYIARRQHRALVDEAIDKVVTRHADLLRRLGEA
jgi:predicted transcriptional regulator